MMRRTEERFQENFERYEYDYDYAFIGSNDRIFRLKTWK